MRRLESGLLFSLLLISSIFIPAFADDEKDVNEHVLVTATRLEDAGVAKSDVPAHVTVIDREAIEKSGARNLQDLISQEAGVVLIDQVGNDVQKSLDLRGFAGDEGLAVFVDGARINDPRNNVAALEQIPLNAIERVEITRGPSAALAGGGSEAGVVRVITRRGTSPSAAIAASGGTWNTWRVDGSYGDHYGKFDLFVSGAYDTTDGFRPNSGGDQKRFDANGGFDLGGGRRLGLLLTSSSLDYGNPGALTLAEFHADPTQNTFNLLDNSNVDQRQASMTFQGPVGAGFSVATTLGFRNDKAKTLTTGRAAPTFGGFFLDADADTWSLVAQASREFKSGDGSHLLAFGLEGLDGSSDDTGFSTPPADPGTYDPNAPSSSNTAKTRNAAIFAQDSWTITSRWNVMAGVRGDSSRVSYDETIAGPASGQTTFDQISPRAGVTFHPSVAVDLYASYADAFLPPTAEQLYAFPGFGSNPDLKPEDARAFELGTRSRGRIGSLEAALFWTTTKDEIIFDPTPTATDPFGRNVNAGETARRGVEVSGRGTIGRGVSAFANATYTDSSFTSGPNDGNEVPLVPKWRLAAGVDAALPRGFGLRADALYVGSQVLDNDPENAQQRLPDYTVVNVRLSWERSLGTKRGRVQVFASALNLLDETYATRGIYALDFSTFVNEVFVTPAPGRRYLAGIGWRL
ncbi:MAG TPA: TonB-dependent receptor [Candidatus Polarisedimenticolaceae bacterium]|nr:TonB-dependent receptor [Candidatus Polarisedimenticolaceae bacterium]